MQHFRLTRNSHSIRRFRNGVTLTEVLMSIMIMGIGVVSLATLFPISTLKVLDATNRTNSTVARFNAEGALGAFPQMASDPDGDSTTDEKGTNYVVDPLGWYELAAQSGTNPLRYEYNRPPTTSAFRITQPPFAQQTRYLGDRLPPNSALISSIDVARQIASLPDTTIDFGEGFPDPDGVNAAAYVRNGPGLVTGLIMPIDEVDLTVFTLPTTNPAYQNPTGYQVLILDVTGDYSEIRQIESVVGQTIGWPSRPLPARYSSIVGLVRIERAEPYYTWMLTVRKSPSGPVNIDVVVFNKRDFSELSEQLYVGDLRRYTLGADLVPGTAGLDLNFNLTNNDLGELGHHLSDDQPNNRVTVDWDPNLYTIGPDKPLLKRGGYFFDAANALWYQIQSIQEASTTTSATLALETAISRDNTEDLIENNMPDTGEDLNGDGIIDRGGLIIPRGVIAVFPLRTTLQ
jgi:prepilin-type N-terminal cleavage/methylation domain-containing protein